MKQHKKYVYILLLTFLSLNLSAQNEKSQMGLINRLIEIKYTSELYLTVNGKNELSRDSALAIYNIMRWQIDGFVFQLCSDMIASNGMRKMNTLNKWYLKGRPTQTSKHSNFENIKQYIIQLNNIEADYQKYIQPLHQGNRNINITTNVFYLIKDSWTILKGLSDMKTQKVMALVELIDQTRLISPSDIIKHTK